MLSRRIAGCLLAAGAVVVMAGCSSGAAGSHPSSTHPSTQGGHSHYVGLGGKPNPVSGVSPTAVVPSWRVASVMHWPSDRSRVVLPLASRSYAGRSIDYISPEGFDLQVLTWVDSSSGVTGPKYRLVQHNLRLAGWTIKSVNLPGADGAYTISSGNRFMGLVLTANRVGVEIINQTPSKGAVLHVTAHELMQLGARAVSYLTH